MDDPTFDLSDDHRRRLIALFAATVASSTLSACSLYGPALTPVSHVAYNEALQQSEQREVLLNLVRLRYIDRPEFLAISSISSQMQFEAQASLFGSFGDDQAASTGLVAPGAVVAYAESPTVIFSPQGGEEFTRRLVSPVDLDSLYLLTRYGWSLDRTLRLIVEDLNGIRNVSTREALTPEDIASSQQFNRVVEAMQSLYERRLIAIGVAHRWMTVSERIPADRVSADDLLKAAAEGYRFDYDAESATYTLAQRARSYVLRIAPNAAATPDLDSLLATLGLPADQSFYDIDSAESPETSSGSGVTIRMRSMLASMAYLSAGVTVPESDPLGSVLSSSNLDELFRVVSSEEPPADAFVAVPYRGRWFHIEAGDLESRRTFGLLSSLIRLEISAGGSQSVPVLTLPLSR
jgi:hypothetical protein